MKRILIAVVLMSLPLTASAGVKCSDFEPRTDNYEVKSEELAKLARLPGDGLHKYQEMVVSDLCSGNIKNVDYLVDNGSVEAKEAQSIAKVLGLTYKVKKRSARGIRYANAHAKLYYDLGLCSACASSAAYYYTDKPNSKCGKMAKKALEGNSAAIEALSNLPDYCQ